MNDGKMRPTAGMDFRKPRFDVGNSVWIKSLRQVGTVACVLAPYHGMPRYYLVSEAPGVLVQSVYTHEDDLGCTLAA